MKTFIKGIIKIIMLIVVAIVSTPFMLIGLVQIVGGAKKSKCMDIFEKLTNM